MIDFAKGNFSCFLISSHILAVFATLYSDPAPFRRRRIPQNPGSPPLRASVDPGVQHLPLSVRGLTKAGEGVRVRFRLP